MSFTGNGITNCYPDQVDNFISITVLCVWSTLTRDSERGIRQEIIRLQ